MITANFLSYRPWEMKLDYQDVVEKELYSAYGPDDFGALDAPQVIASGCWYSYEYFGCPGKFSAMPGSCSREP